MRVRVMFFSIDLLLWGILLAVVGSKLVGLLSGTIGIVLGFYEVVRGIKKPREAERAMPPKTKLYNVPASSFSRW